MTMLICRRPEFDGDCRRACICTLMFGVLSITLHITYRCFKIRYVILCHFEFKLCINICLVINHFVTTSILMYVCGHNQKW